MENRHLCRGKRTDNGEWVEGYLSYPFCTEKGNESYYFYAKDSLDFFCRCVVDASTICQCTGLKDKNGKLIWENDIVIVPSDEEPCLLEWEDGDGCWSMKQDGTVYTFDNFWSNEVEVIGNKFDNVEFLEDSCE